MSNTKDKTVNNPGDNQAQPIRRILVVDDEPNIRKRNIVCSTCYKLI